MAGIPLTAALRAEYQSLFDSCQVKPAKSEQVDKALSRLIANEDRYAAVGGRFGIPWSVVAMLHNMECSQDFRQHLHNGDPLTRRTTRVPAGRPANPDPPYTWEISASDALVYDGLTTWQDWSIPGVLYCLERYNGWGYRRHHPEVKSPYLWSGSNHYTSGKYVADGTWSNSAVSGQIGAATMLRRLAERDALDAEPHVAEPEIAAGIASSSALFKYAPNKVTPGGAELQRYLNGFPGIFLREDGKLGKKTSAAYRQVFGHYLVGDPRSNGGAR
jgi:lysozyme family protein